MNNKPVAWILTDNLEKAMKAPFLCRVEPTNRLEGIMTPIYTQEQLEEARKLGMQQERALWNLSESTQEIMNTHPVKEQSNLVNVVKDHIKDLQECVLILNDSMLVNTANEMKVAIKELKDAIDTHPVKELTDEEIEQVYKETHFSETIGDCDYMDFARAILRKAQEK